MESNVCPLKIGYRNTGPPLTNTRKLLMQKIKNMIAGKIGMKITFYFIGNYVNGDHAFEICFISTQLNTIEWRHYAQA